MVLQKHDLGRAGMAMKSGGRRFGLKLLLSVALCGMALGQSSRPTARDIVARSLRADNDAGDTASRYTYRERDVTKELDSSGGVRKTTSETREILFLGGKRYERLVAKDDQPLPAGEAKKEAARIDKAAAAAALLTPEQRERRFADYRRERAKERESAKMIPDAYTFTFLPDAEHDGRPCYKIDASPLASFNGKYGNLLRRMRGTLWIDKTDLEWVRVDAEVLDDVSFGLFLARMSKGSHFVLERARINGEVWLPKYVSARVAARALVKRFNIDETVTYSDYRRFSTDSRIVTEP